MSIPTRSGRLATMYRECSPSHTHLCGAKLDETVQKLELLEINGQHCLVPKCLECSIAQVN